MPFNITHSSPVSIGKPAPPPIPSCPKIPKILAQRLNQHKTGLILNQYASEFQWRLQYHYNAPDFLLSLPLKMAYMCPFSSWVFFGKTNCTNLSKDTIYSSNHNT